MTRPDLTDEQLDALLSDARDNWRTDAPLDTDALWAGIEQTHFDAPAAPTTFSWSTPSWRHVALATAAALTLGLGLGRFTASTEDGTLVAAVNATRDGARTALRSDTPDDPMRSTTTEYFGETAALLASLARESGSGVGSPESLEANARFAADATNLLSTTRLLLDARSSTDPQLRALLDDLELVLAQIARLPSRHMDDELAFIAEAIETRDVVPRLRLAAADYQMSAQ